MSFMKEGCGPMSVDDKGHLLNLVLVGLGVVKKGFPAGVLLD